MHNIYTTNILLNIKQRYDYIGKTLNIVISLRIFGLEYLYSIDLNNEGRILEISRIDKKLIIIKYKLSSCRHIEVYFTTEVDIETFFLVVVGRWRNAYCNEVVIENICLRNHDFINHKIYTEELLVLCHPF